MDISKVSNCNVLNMKNVFIHKYIYIYIKIFIRYFYSFY